MTFVTKYKCGCLTFVYDYNDNYAVWCRKHSFTNQPFFDFDVNIMQTTLQFNFFQFQFMFVGDMLNGKRNDTGRFFDMSSHAQTDRSEVVEVIKKQREIIYYFKKKPAVRRF